MTGFDSTRDVLSQVLVAAILVGVFALLAADRVHRVLVPIGAVALLVGLALGAARLSPEDTGTGGDETGES